MYISILGDIAFNGLLSSDLGNNTIRYNKVTPYLSESSLVIANLETPIKVDEYINKEKKHIHFTKSKATRQLLSSLNIGCVSLANNHIYDCKLNGLKATINLLDELGIKHTGAGWEKEHILPVFIDTEEIKIGFVAYVDKSTNPKTEDFPELLVNYYEPEKVINDIKSIRSAVNIVIVSIHWGVDYSYYPTPNQVSIAHELIDAGADIIMGHHPHTFQPFEKYKNGHIFYSLGSFTFGDYIREGKTELQALFRKTKKSAIVSYYPGENRLEFTPTYELQGNYIVIDKRDYFKWSARKWLHYKIKHSCRFFEKLYNFNEQVLYRIYEYFFGYYKNPISRLFQFSNIKKIKRLF